MLNLKELRSTSRGDCWNAFSRLCRPWERVATDLLILQRLFASLARGANQGLLNLKDLLAVFTVCRKGSFRKRVFWKASSSCRIVPNFAVFEQKRADNRTKWGFLGTGFWSARQVARESNTAAQRRGERVRRPHEMSFVSRRFAFFSVPLCCSRKHLRN